MTSLALNFTDREKEIVEEVAGILKKYLAPKKITLFGSRAKGTNRFGSDFDFAVDGGKPESGIHSEIFEAIDEIAGLYSVDVVFLDNVDPGFKEIILETGKVVYEK